MSHDLILCIIKFTPSACETLPIFMKLTRNILSRIRLSGQWPLTSAAVHVVVVSGAIKSNEKEVRHQIWGKCSLLNWGLWYVNFLVLCLFDVNVLDFLCQINCSMHWCCARLLDFGFTLWQIVDDSEPFILFAMLQFSKCHSLLLVFGKLDMASLGSLLCYILFFCASRCALNLFWV